MVKYTNVPVGSSTSKTAEKYFPTLEEAQLFCKTEKKNILFALMEPNIWMNREDLLMEEGKHIYLENVVDADFPAGHYARLDETTEYVRFFPDHKHGVLNRLVSMRVMKYLLNFTKLRKRDAEYWAAFLYSNFNDAITLKIENTRKAFKDVYRAENSPRSCMTSRWRGLPCHPVEAYAAGDLAIAYITSVKNPEKVLARTIVFPAKKIYSRMYGDSGKVHFALFSRLKQMGYKQSDDFSGAKLLKIPAHRFFKIRQFFGFKSRSFMMPYLDCGNMVIDVGEHFLLSKETKEFPQNKVYRARTLCGTMTIH